MIVSESTYTELIDQYGGLAAEYWWTDIWKTQIAPGTPLSTQSRRDWQRPQSMASHFQ